MPAVSAVLHFDLFWYQSIFLQCKFTSTGHDCPVPIKKRSRIWINDSQKPRTKQNKAKQNLMPVLWYILHLWVVLPCVSGTPYKSPILMSSETRNTRKWRLQLPATFHTMWMDTMGIGLECQKPAMAPVLRSSHVSLTAGNEQMIFFWKKKKTDRHNSSYSFYLCIIACMWKLYNILHNFVK